jgi:tetratricopeptide (TPR) repeat protein
VPKAGRKGSLAELRGIWQFENPRNSELRFRRLFRGATGATNAVRRAELLTQIARAQGLQRRFHAGHRTLDRILPTTSRLGSRVMILYSLERGRVFRSEGRSNRALPLFLAAWKISRQSGEDGLAVDAAHMVALVKSGTSQVSWNLRALNLATRSRDPEARRWKGSLLNNQGWAEFERGDYVAALHSFKLALRGRQQERIANETRIAKWCVAKTLRLLGRTKAALRVQRNLLTAWRGAGAQDGYVFEEIAECLWALGRSEEARPFFRMAQTELSKDLWCAAQEPARLKRLGSLGVGP